MKKSIALGSLMLVAGAAFAADDGQHWYVAPKIGATFVDEARSADDALFYGLSIGKHLNENWALELNAIAGSYDGSPGADLDLTALSLDALRFFNRDGRVSPYLTFGLGDMKNDLDGVRERDSLIVQFGAGLSIRAWENASGSRAFNLRPEIKVRREDAGSSKMSDVLAGVAFEFAFGAPTERAAPPMAAPAPVTPPPPAPVAAPPAPPADSDGDGVLDNKDNCPDTPRGTAVDEAGCPRKGSITLVGVNFENDSAKLKPESFTVLDAVAADLKQFPRLRVEVQGHTDSVGSDAYNQRLSQGRAESVRGYLIEQGVPAAQLEARGYGESQPVAPNATPDGRAQNRRVAMDVLDNPGDVQVNKAAN